MPFTYLIKNKTTNMCYYGVRFAKNCNPSSLWTTYFTSSKLVKELIKQFGKEDFVYEIRKIFKTKEEAIYWEQNVLKRLDIRNNNNFLNIDYYQQPYKAIQNKIDTIFISNRETNTCIRIPSNKQIPIGWYKGNINHTSGGKNKKYMWAHNPITEKSGMFKNVEDIPKNWILNRPKSHSNKNTLKSKKSHWYNNGEKNKLFTKDDIIQDGWFKGRINKYNKNKKYIHNENIEKYINKNDNVPLGWSLGRRKNINSVKNRIYITNGIQTKRISKNETIPELWYKGTHYNLATMKGKKGPKQIGRKAIILKTGERKNWYMGDKLPDGAVFMDKNFIIKTN